MFSELVLVVGTLGGLVYFNEYLPFFMQSQIDKCKLIVLKKSMAITIKCVNNAGYIRSEYVWLKRSKCHYFVKKVLDYIMRIDTIRADLYVATGKESISISGAYVLYKGFHYDVLNTMKLLWDSGDGVQITFFLQNILSLYKLFVDNESKISLIVEYSGHSNKTKRMECGSFSVKYDGISSERVVFPPYSSLECVKKGLGTTRVISASLESGKDCTQIARNFGGLKGTFYKELKTGTIKSNVVTFIETSFSGYDEPIVNVFTSKGKVLCNENGFDEAIIVD
jgi:hypothetical protein